MTLQQFIDKYTGQTKGYPTDKDYQGECLSIVKIYIKECFGINPPASGTGGAEGYWSQFPSPLGTVFQKINNDDGVVPMPGDIVIWSTAVGGGYGHIDICVSSSVDSSKFTGFDQNWSGKAAHLQGHYYTNVLGWLRPKETMNDDEIAIKKSDFENLVRKSSLYDEFTSAGYGSATEVKQLVSDLRKSIDDKQAALDSETKRAEGFRSDFNDLLNLCAATFNTQQELNQVKVALAKVATELDDLDLIQKNYAALQLSSGTEKENLNAEIARLNALLKQENVLANASVADLIRELIKRLTTIVKRK